MDRVVDANVALALVLSTPYSDRAESLWQRWAAAEALVFAPDLWAYEVTSALRKAMVITGIELREAVARLDVLTALGVRLVPPTPALDRSALRWAERLQQTVAYDAHYLALAEFLGCDLWTADRRLATRMDSNAPRVHWLGDVETH